MESTRNRHKNQNYILLAITLFFIILDASLIFFEFDLQIIIIISNIDILLLLFISYKYLTKGYLLALFFNVFNGINMYINYLIEDDLIYFQMSLYRIVSISLSSLIYLLARKQYNYLQTSSYLDGLTEVFNHRFFQERLDTEFSKAKRTNSCLGIMLVDIDNFTKFNRMYGHRKGDDVLVETAEIICQSVREQDIVCRYGGDDFAIILPDLKQDEIQEIAETIHGNYKEYVENYREANELSISVSLGYSTFPNIAITKEELFTQADTALHHAKQQGRSNIKVYKDVFMDIKNILSTTESQLFTSLKTLLGTISAKDRYTLGHSERVMDYAVGIGMELGLSDEEIKILKIAALLHDVGKIEIPQQILNKKEKLTNEEFELIKLHPVYSAEIIKPFSSLGKLYSIVLHHHERYDGRGYPKGIKGEDIPLESRILTVADSFDAMLSDRPYRESLSIEAAILELQNGSDTQFDKNIVAAFLKMLNKNH